MRVLVIVTTLLVAQAARAGSVPFPEIDSGPVCEEFAQKAPERLRGIVGGVAAAIDPEKVKESARAGCVKAHDATRKQVRALWDRATDAQRRTCQGKTASYAELGLCLSQVTKVR
jgi:hypothetical protein